MSQVEVHPVAFREMLTVLEMCLVRAVASIPMAQDVVAIGLVQIVEAIAVARMIAVAQQAREVLPL